MIYTYEIVNIEFRYVIELCENGLYSLKFQKWDDGKSVYWNFPPGWGDYDTESIIHIYESESDARRDGNIFMIERAAFETIDIGGYKVVWYWKDESDASKLPVDNLRIYNNKFDEVWNMKRVLNRSEMCTGIHCISEESFAFTTFSCENIVIQINDNEIKCVRKTLTR